MGDELKRLVVIVGAILVAGAGLLMLPLMKLRVPQRPSSVPATALYATSEGVNYWIDCPDRISLTRYYCTVYSRDGKDKLVQGVFQKSAAITQGRITYDGSSIRWKYGAVLDPLHLDCVAGGRPPDVADCRAAAGR